MAAMDPPAVERDPALSARLQAAYEARGKGYVPRTQLIENGRAKYVNRLIEEPSPYLLQHAHNPVDWRPWSDETLAEAAARGLPIFLSVGYSTCHWCHVMEEESFDNEAVAALLNAHFIPVKMDREQHPELDHLYITATQLQQGHAGWPNSLWLLPDGRPFHTGTYMPREHFMQVLSAIAAAWSDNRRSEIERVAEEMARALTRLTHLSGGEAVALGPEVAAAAVAGLAEMHNDLEGGFSQTQQFPQEGFLLFLLDQWRSTGDARALEIATTTLDAIVAGGIHDHVGGGFHRYTVDPNWRTPHFEKMMYNQGLLTRALVEAWEITGKPAYRRAAERAIAYVLRDMTDADGAFHAAEDADSRDARGELEEGAFYVWPPAEAAAVVGDEVIRLLGLDQAPTLEAGPVAHLAPQAEVDFARLDPMLERLRLARDDRARPLRDDKVIAGWNGLMIRAIADASVAFDRPDLRRDASRAAETIWSRLWDGRTLGRLWSGGARSAREGALEDYAWMGLAMLSLHDATGEAIWRDRASDLADAAWARFGDGTGRLRMAAADGPLGPIYDSADGATPSGESSALELYVRLSRRSAAPEAVHRAETLRAALSPQMSAQPLLRPDAVVAGRALDAGETGFRRTIANGTLRLRLLAGRLRIDIAEGWHLNAHDPGPDWLVGARIEGGEADWPAGTPLAAGFSGETISVYDGRLDIALRNMADRVELHLQVCSDSICLDPETPSFRLP